MSRIGPKLAVTATWVGCDHLVAPLDHPWCAIAEDIDADIRALAAHTAVVPGHDRRTARGAGMGEAMSATYVIRRGEVRGAGEYAFGEPGEWTPHQHKAQRWPGRKSFPDACTVHDVVDEVRHEEATSCRAVRLLPAGTMRARRKAAARRKAVARELRALVGEMRRAWPGMRGVMAMLEARAAELEDT